MCQHNHRLAQAAAARLQRRWGTHTLLDGHSCFHTHALSGNATKQPALEWPCSYTHTTALKRWLRSHACLGDALMPMQALPVTA